MKELIDYMKTMAHKFNLKYDIVESLHCSYYHYISHRISKDRVHYVELLLWKDMEPSIHYRNGESGGGGFKATKENIYSYLVLFGCVPKIEQLTLF